MPTTPWDVRLARLLIAPLRGTWVRPNHVTTLGLLTGLASAAAYAHGGYATTSWGAGLFLLTSLLDHADGELARSTGTTSTFGHHYDRVADLIVKIALFTGMGIGLRARPDGGWAIAEGLAGGVAVVTIFVFRGRIAALKGNAALRQPSFAGFELEDLLYLLIPPVTWLGHLRGFVTLAGIGAPAFALLIVRQYRVAAASVAPRAARRVGALRSPSARTALGPSAAPSTRSRRERAHGDPGAADDRR